MTDWKARCAELLSAVTALHEQDVDAPYSPTQDAAYEDLIARTRAELAQPEPDGPGPVDYRRWYEAHSEDCNTWSEQPTAPLTLRTTVEALAWANYCLARFARPAIEPVPVGERLPGLKDCDTKGRCWFIDDDEKWCPVILGDILDEDEPDAIQRIICYYGYTHWIQGWALPLPTSQENPQ